MAAPVTMTGARVICYVNGLRFGRLTKFNFRSMTPRKATYGLDTVDPTELAPTISRCICTMTVLRTTGDGGAEGAGIATNFEDLPRERYFTIQLIDRATDRVIFQAQRCSVSSQTWDMPAKGVITGQIEFEAIDWSNEIRPLGVAS